ncbi:TIGR02556 family CRISPR-associated protein [Herbivorax sp. ANBcel31]|uniref:TIGR02556 family CRISPR-associated protein n=1 Tax=Herbivorax sp. ANBcel31 TaxID=3069754 RepID=UPI0027B18143|nr:TIGR02556 family CRISPR-associated protein [Herbivorax sp. ANBcel31]MDQ2085340.1 TIGR02556 family CRISPR-associated protein [Herbivorax sp. ANBcel31]
MLAGLLQLGDYVTQNRDAETNPYLEVIENPNEKGSYNHVLKITFEEGEELIYRGIEYEEFDLNKISKYAYKKGSPRGGDITPTSKYTNIERTLSKISTSIKNLVANTDGQDEEKTIFKNIYDYVVSNEEEIKSNLDEKIKSISLKKGESFIITIVTIKNGIENYLGDFQMVKNYLGRILNEQYYNKYGKVSKGNGICYYCKNQSEVFGFVNTFNSYTVDKIGFVTGGFKQEKAWRNYPVCGECAQKLNQGKKYVRQNLSSKFSGFNYFIIPKTVIRDKEDEEEFTDILNEFEKDKKFSTKDKAKKNLLASERNFLEVMKDSKNYLNYNMLIYKEEQSGSVFKILLYIEDIVPSKVKHILRIKDEVEDINLFRNLPGKEKTFYDMKFTFEKLRYFFPNNSMEGDFDKNFLEILNNVFTYKKISYKFLLGRMISKTRVIFSNDGYLGTPVLYALMNIMFINKLSLFNDKRKGVKRIMVEKTEKNKKYLDFFENESYKDVFDSDYKRAVFLTGVLVENLLNVQYRERGSKPFYSRLNGLKLNRQLLKRIFTEAINKLNEYEKNYYAELEHLIGMYMLGEDKSVSNDDISFYFVLGMTLAKHFKKKSEEEEE